MKKILVFGIAVAIAAALAGAGVGALLFVTTEVPHVSSVSINRLPQSTAIYDRTGEVLLWEVHGEEKRTVVSLDKISRHLKNATIAIEDDSFYRHKGIRITAIIRAIVMDVFTGARQGGSTITQQVVKNTLLTPERTILRKIKEFVLALKLERVRSKDEILALYLNSIPYGSDLYGAQAASKEFFGVSANNLSVAQAASLAALPKAPTYFSPYGNHRDKLDERKNIILKRMRDLNFITTEEYTQAREEKIVFTPPDRFGIRAPHFVMYVRELLATQYGEDIIEREGLKVITTLDTNLQAKGEEIISAFVPENEKKFNASNAGLIALDPKTGDVLAMVGSRDYFDTDREGNFNITLAKRQPGSTFKPFVYATAFKKGYTPNTVLFDVETQFEVRTTNEDYAPQNYDNIFRGPVTMREALAQSINVPSVKTLYLAGLNDSLVTARAMGIRSLTDPLRYGLTLVLGGGEVSLLELTSAYGVFARDGIRIEPQVILRVEDAQGNLLQKTALKKERVLDESIARLINDILTDNQARAPAFGASSPLFFPSYDVAAKTGTTNDSRDAWIIGYTPSLAVGAWAGNNDNTPMIKSVAGFIVAPLWHEFMSYALTTRPAESFPDPPSFSSVTKPILRGEWQSINGTSTVHSILHWVDKDNPQGLPPEHPEEDPQYELWEEPVQKWAEKNTQKSN
jgi:1A family penicillin-binding protein